MDFININHIQAFTGNQQLVNLKVSIFSLGTFNFLDTFFRYFVWNSLILYMQTS